MLKTSGLHSASEEEWQESDEEEGAQAASIRCICTEDLDGLQSPCRMQPDLMWMDQLEDDDEDS